MTEITEDGTTLDDKQQTAAAPIIVNNPFYPNRTQSDGLGDYESERTGTVFTEPSLTRQEFKDEADINWLLNRHGANTQVRQGGDYTEVDYSMDLIDAYALQERAAQIQAPEELRGRYPTWRHIMAGMENGQYVRDLTELEETKRQQEAAAKMTAKPPTDTPA